MFFEQMDREMNNNNYMNTEPPIKDPNYDVYFGPGLRKRILKHLHGRYVLILVCTLVVVECMCIMAELMVDLQGIRIRFENEEKGVQEFIKFMKMKNPDTFGDFEGKQLAEILTLMKESSSLWNQPEESKCDCKCDRVTTSSTNQDPKRRKRDANNSTKYVSITKSTNNTQGRSGANTQPVIQGNSILGAVSNKLLDAMSKHKTDSQTASILKTHNMPDRINDTDKQSDTVISSIPVNESEHSTQKHAKGNLNFHTGDEEVDIKDRRVIDLSSRGALSPAISNLEHVIGERQHGSRDKTDRQESLRLSVSQNRTDAQHEAQELLHSHLLTRHKRDDNDDTVNKVFVFVVNTEVQNFHLAARFVDMDKKTIAASDIMTDEIYASFQKQYDKIHSISYVIKYTGFSILSMMVAETLLKLACMGFGFFKKKFEVFDAFIVFVSFALDVIFQDNRWYETGKDATTILVLLLPWRVVRIVNSFLMTINHKHYIEVMTIRRAKKRLELKLKKVQNLIVEMRRDIDLLISLGKVKGATDAEISACIYGKGRGTTTLAAITSFASLMFISTLGKDPCSGDTYDDVYGDIIRDILSDDEDGNSEKTTTESATEKEDFDLESICQEATYTSKVTSENIAAKNNNNNTATKKRGEEWPMETRRATVPRRQASCGDESQDRSVFYVNDGYVTGDDVRARNSSMYSKSSVRSMPAIGGEAPKKFMAFEVTTQVTYL